MAQIMGILGGGSLVVIIYSAESLVPALTIRLGGLLNPL